MLYIDRYREKNLTKFIINNSQIFKNSKIKINKLTVIFSARIARKAFFELIDSKEIVVIPQISYSIGPLNYFKLYPLALKMLYLLLRRQPRFWNCRIHSISSNDQRFKIYYHKPIGLLVPD